MPAVSVIIPTYNRAESIGTAIRSVLNQTEKDFEIVVVDDGSIDDTERVVRGFRDPRIRYFRQQVNGGDAAARNAGIRHSTSPYVAFLDDDDEWFPRKLALQMGVFARLGERIGLVHGAQTNLWHSTGRSVTQRFEGDTEAHLRWFLITTSAVVVRRTAIEKVGLFDERMVTSSDCDMWIRLWSAGVEFEYVTEPIVRYHIHSNGLTGNLRKLIEGSELLLRKHESFFSQHPPSYSAQLHGLGIYYFGNGEVRQARAAFRLSIRLEPRLRNGAYYLLTFLGPAAFPWIGRIRDRLKGWTTWHRASSVKRSAGGGLVDVTGSQLVRRRDVDVTRTRCDELARTDSGVPPCQE